MYVFLAVAPCSFTIGNKNIKLSAGSTFTIGNELGEQLRANSFPYKKHLRLMSIVEEESNSDTNVSSELTSTNTSTEVKSDVLVTREVSTEIISEEKQGLKTKRPIKKTEV